MTLRDLAIYLFKKKCYLDFDENVTEDDLSDYLLIYNKYIDPLFGHTYIASSPKANNSKARQILPEAVNSFLDSINNFDHHNIAKNLTSDVLVIMINYLKITGNCPRDLRNPIWYPKEPHISESFTLTEYKELFNTVNKLNIWEGDLSSYTMALLFALVPFLSVPNDSKKLSTFTIEYRQDYYFTCSLNSKSWNSNSYLLCTLLYDYCSSGLIYNPKKNEYNFNYNQYVTSYNAALLNVGYSKREIAQRSEKGLYFTRFAKILPSTKSEGRDINEQELYLKLFLGLIDNE
jgi:hypothetical protein